MESCRIKKNQWADERQMSKVFLLARVTKFPEGMSRDPAQLEWQMETGGEGKKKLGEASLDQVNQSYFLNMRGLLQ